MTQTNFDLYNQQAEALCDELNRRNTDYTWSVRGGMGQILAYTNDLREDNEAEALSAFWVRAKTKQVYEHGSLYIWTLVSRELVEDDITNAVYILKILIDGRLNTELSSMSAEDEL